VTEKGKPAFRRAVEARDLGAMIDCLAVEAVLKSPVSFAPFTGRKAVGQLLAVLLEVFQDFAYSDQLTASDGTCGLVFRARVGGRELEGLDLLRFDETGKIRELTVMVRPRSGLEALQREVGARLAGFAAAARD